VATARVITTERASQRPSGRAATNSYAAFDGNIATPDIAPSAVSRTPVGNLTVSPAVSGILKLRDRAGTVQPQPSEDEGLDDDAIWARELLAATGGRR
jgi:hypothetical protein